MKKTLNIGLLGFGAMGKTHAFSVASLPFYFEDINFSAKYTAVCTSRYETARSAAETYNLGCPTDNEDDIINDSAIDVVDICTPNINHYETAKKAILAGKHVLCEKPLAINALKAAELDGLAKDAFAKNGQVCGIVFNNRHLAAIRRAKEIINEGRLGRILTFDFRYYHNSCIDPERTVGWKQDKDICGAGTLFDLGSHIVDLCRYLCG